MSSIGTPESITVGRKAMREMRGDAFIANRDKNRNSFNEVIQDLSDGVCFGQIWSREGLDRKRREMVVIAQLIALNRPNQLRNHLDGAINMGFTVDEIKEICLQSAMYCGLPCAIDAFRIAEEVLRARKLLD